MNIQIYNSAAEAAGKIAAEIAAQIQKKNNSVLILPTGGTPIPVYEELAALHKAGKVSFADVTTFNLDEYKDIAPDHYERYYNFMQRNLFSKVDAKPENINVPNSEAADSEKECVEYEAKYRAAGCADIALLGIGHNGHIGFNEPGTSFDSVTHVTDITPRTIEANARFFDSADLVPKQAMTMGISSILAAKRIILLATGEGKAEIIKKLMEAKAPTEEIPATALLNHPQVEIYVDKDAASLL